MSAEEREVKQRMTAYAKQSLASDARLLDLRFEEGSSSWLASAVSKASGTAEIVAVKENGQWQLSSTRATKSLSRAMTGTRIENESFGKVLGKMVGRLAFLAILGGAGYIGFPYAQAALKQLPAISIQTPGDKPNQMLTDKLDSHMLNSANELANDPARKAALEKATSKLLGDHGAAKGLGQLERINAEAAGQQH